MEIPTEGCLCWDFFLRGCTCLKCTNRAEMHHLLGWCSRDCCTPWKCTNRASTAPTELTIRGYVEVRGGCVKTQLLGFQPVYDHIFSFTGQQYFVTNIL